MIYGYVRISSKTQNEERQIAALKNERVAMENIFIDKESGKDFNRTAWQKLMSKLIIGEKINGTRKTIRLTSNQLDKIETALKKYLLKNP